MALAGAALQKAVFERLSTDAALMDLIGVGKVFDYIPDGTLAPFVMIGDDGDEEAATAEFTDLFAQTHEVSLTLHTWTEAPRGRLTARQVLSRVHDLLILDPPLVLAGFDILRTLFVAAQVLREEDTLTYHGVLRCRYSAHPQGGYG